ncbi:MAG: hypothetical protein EOP22_04530 [Hyphomicrobiales bacterium]|nr:MAG: hypothetical protein EOP22_04530 [Hyphomicrobiales bacterium]
MPHVLKLLLALLSAGLMALAATAPSLGQAEPEVRVFVPDVPGGVIVSNCYRAVGNVYGARTFEICLKQRGTYTARGAGLRCNGRLNWDVEGIHVNIQLRRTSCGNGVAWSADRLSCRPSLILGLIAGLLKQDKPLLDNLVCDYTPAKGSGAKKTSFVVHRI